MYRLLSLLVGGVLTLLTIGASAQRLPGPGNCLTFGGSTYVNCGTSNRGITRQVTLECWIKTTSFDNQWIIGKYSNQFAEEKGYHLATWNGTAILAGRTGNGSYYTSGFSTTLVNDGRWHHIAGVIDNRDWRLYVDGVLEASAQQNYTTANLANTVPLLIGDYYDQRNRPFTGDIDEVRVWRVPRTEAQIREVMCQKFAVASPDLVAYYRLDNTSGLTARDDGTQPTPGVLNGFSGQSWHLSGAALGDRSVFRYSTAGWNSALLKLPTLVGDTLAARAFSTNTRGAHLYIVDAAPNVAVPGTPVAAAYGGVFSAGSNVNYQVGLSGLPTCIRFYRRADNTTSSWTLLNLSQQSGGINTAPDNYRGEYAWGNGSLTGVNISGDTLLCPGQVVRLTANAPGASGFQWSTGATDSTLTVTQPGVYTVQATSAAGCSASASRRVELGTTAPSFSLGQDTLICGPINLQLHGPSGPTLTYRWNDGSTNRSLQVRQPGLYILTVAAPCGLPQVDSVEISNTSLTTPTISGDTLLCPGQAVQLTASAAGATAFRWNTGSTGNILTVTQPGTYTVEATVAGCRTSAFYTVRSGSLAPLFSLGNDTILCGAINLVLQAPTASPGLVFRWSDGSQGTSLTVRQPGVYSLIVSGPCGAPQADSIKVGSVAASFSVPNVITPNGDKLNDTFVVTESCGVGAWALDIYNRWGRRIYSVETYANDWAAPDVPAGLYYYLLRRSTTGQSFKGWVEVMR